MSNPPTVEFIMDALRVARAAVDPSPFQRFNATCDYHEKVYPAFAVALMEDWLRLRERVELLRYYLEATATSDNTECGWAQEALDKDAALAKQG